MRIKNIDEDIEMSRSKKVSVRKEVIAIPAFVVGVLLIAVCLWLTSHGVIPFASGSFASALAFVGAVLVGFAGVGVMVGSIIFFVTDK